MSEACNRRSVLLGAAALAGAAALPPLLRAQPRRGGATHVVVDERYSHSAAFAEDFPGARIHTVGALNDLCQRWYTQLRREVLTDRQAIAGLTTWMDYEVMRSCAAEIGYRASARVQARASGDHLRLFSWEFAPRST